MSNNNFMLKSLEQKLTNFVWLEKLEKFFFSLFLLSIPLQTRLTFPTAKTYLFGAFNEYATFFIYLSDIFLLITLFLYFVKSISSSTHFFFTGKITSCFTKYFSDDQNNKIHYYKDDLTKINIISVIKHKLSTSTQLIPIFFLFLLVLWSFLSILWSSYQNIALYKSLKLLELSLFFIYLNKRFNWFGIRRLFTLVFIAGAVESVIGILQYSYQHSLGLKLLGESLLTPNIDNVAKIVVGGERIIRAYGTFPHPNIFAAFLILSIFSGICLLLSFKESGKHQIVSCLSTVATTLKKMLNLSHKKQIVSRETIYTKLSALLVKLFHACSPRFAVEAGPPKPSQFKKWLTLNEITKLFHVKQFERYSTVVWLVFLIFGVILQVYALILTFSRIAWLGLGLVIVLFLFQVFKSTETVSRLLASLCSRSVPTIALTAQKTACLTQNNQIVSRLPAVAAIFQKIFNPKQFNQIVSRETISTETKEGETILNKTQTSKTILYQVYKRLIPLYGKQKDKINSFRLTNKLFHACSPRFAVEAGPPQPSQLKKWLTQSKIIKLFHVKQFDKERKRVKQLLKNSLNKAQKISFIIIVISIAIIAGVYWNKIVLRTVDIDQKYQQSLDNRVLYNNIALNIIKQHPLAGIGNGNFTLKMSAYIQNHLEWWQYQPAHNIYLLITSELGMIGLVIFVILILMVINNAYLKQNNQIVSRETISTGAKVGKTISAGVSEGETILFKNFIFLIFITFLLMGLFDHYFWTLQQGQLTFWIVLGAIAAINYPNKKIELLDNKKDRN